MSQKVASAWYMLEDLQCKENNRKLKIRGHRRVSDGWTHQQCQYLQLDTLLGHFLLLNLVQSSSDLNDDFVL